MNIEQLKNAWNEYDKSLDSKINLELLKTVSVSKTNSLTREFKFNAIVESIVSLVVINIMGRLVINQITVWEYWVPALVIGLISLGTVIWNVHALVQLSMLHYDATIASMQKKMERIYTQSKWQNSTLHYLVVPLVAAMFAIMGLKFLHLGLASHLDIILYAIIAGIVVVPLVVWIIKLFPDKEMESAISFLDEIKKFERED
jgi:hypothetical protein